jgi:hypothetical protein
LYLPAKFTSVGIRSRRTELTEAQCDVIARIGLIEMRDLCKAGQTAFLDAPEAIA